MCHQRGPGERMVFQRQVHRKDRPTAQIRAMQVWSKPRGRRLRGRSDSNVGVCMDTVYISSHPRRKRGSNPVSNELMSAQRGEEGDEGYIR